MTRARNQINLASLPAPHSITPVSTEHELKGLLAEFQRRYAGYNALVESDPVMKLCEVFAYRLAVEKQRQNDAIKAVMLAYASQSDLDHLGANVNVQRLTLTPANLNALPPEAAVMESDEDFRARIQLSIERYSTAGSSGSYEYWAKSASAQVADVQVTSPNPGEVVLFVMSRRGDGSADESLLKLVTQAVNAEDVRPVSDYVTVKSVTVVSYTITAQLIVDSGPDAGVVLEAAHQALTAYVASVHLIGVTVATSGIYAALQQSGVVRVVLSDWSGDLMMNDGQVGYCSALHVTIKTDE